jgi:hypothetical protein
MKIDLSKLNEAQVKELAIKFRKAPCLVCDKPSTGYREIPVGDQFAFIPVCDQCRTVEVATLMSAMQISDATLPPAAGKKTLR